MTPAVYGQADALCDRGLARLWANRGKPEHGRTLLRPILEQFVEGRDTADPLTAARLLEELGGIT